MAPNAVAYCSGVLGPGEIQDHLSDIQSSGLDTAILWAVHIGRPTIAGQQWGDLIYNNSPNLFISEGVFNPNSSSDIAAWPAQVAALKQNGSSVSKIFFSIGGANPPVEDFTSIQYMLQNGLKDVLVENFTALRTAFTVDGVCVIDGIDIDNEESVDASTITDFCTILFDLGFEVTFCPFASPTVWQGYMQTLWDAGNQVSWWNLQAYAGGFGNLSNLSPWINALSAVVGSGQGASYLVPGLSVQGSSAFQEECPDAMCQSFAGVSSDGLAGGFLWNYDSILNNTTACGDSVPTLADYVAAIQNGLTNNCGS